ncbi:MAG: hypothetical protein QNJ00_02550 [Woeseiaceae bacterium]|nr:hypothetical protein [Woeseiaceae bacterium]
MAKRITALVSFFLLAFGCAWASPVEVRIVAPDNYIRGGVFELFAVSENGERRRVDDRVLESADSFVVEVPGRASPLRAELRHPKYRPTHAEIAAGAPVVTLRPARWTAPDKELWIDPAYETSLAGQEHIRWIREVYLERPEELIITETFQKHSQLVSRLAYMGAGKPGDWGKLRQANIAEWKAIGAIVEERTYEPCPEGYVHQSPIRPCGAIRITYIERDPAAEAERAAEKDLELRQMVYAREDLAKRLRVDVSEVRFGGRENWLYQPARVGCTEDMPAASEETPGYTLVYSAGRRGSFYYHGKSNEMPHYCKQR